MQEQDPIIYIIFLIFSGAAVLATLALFARQALLVAYILLGVLLGPHVLSAVDDPALITEISHIGIIFLLFLMGLDLNPGRLIQLMGKTIVITLLSSLVFATTGFIVAWCYGFTLHESLLMGAVMTFSSTILGLKLLPATALHHQRMGEVVISILLLQDLLAILLLVIVTGSTETDYQLMTIGKLVIGLPILIALAYWFVQQVILRLFSRFDLIHEYIFLVAIGWCLGMAQAAAAIGASHEIGAFIAGITLAASPISMYIAENLKPLRDFFLVLFFFALGAGFDVSLLEQALLPALTLVLVLLLLKPLTFRVLLRHTGESNTFASEAGSRLGQLSEFALLVAILAFEHEIISFQASYVIQLATLVSFILSTYFVVLRYPTPIAVSDELRRD
jgi:Kef-type K+ transport system membrane component KefB